MTRTPKVITKEIKDVLSGKAILTVKLYRTIEAVIKAHFKVPLSEVSEICGEDGYGNQYKISIEQMKDNIKQSGCWGFVTRKKNIHMWVSPDCGMSELVHFIGHERGHTLKPFYSEASDEEKKAENYGSTARLAYEIGCEIKQLLGEAP